jgi:hypothetical protein
VFKEAHLAAVIVVTALSTTSAANAATARTHSSGEEAQTVFGIKIGEPLGKLPECRYPMKDDAEMCWQNKSSGGAEIRFPTNGQPTWVKGGDFFLNMIDGRVEQFTIGTYTSETGQLAAMQALTAKYGNPEASRIVKKQNSFGAAISSIEATWHVEGVWLFFTGAESMGSGNLWIRSDKMVRKIEDEDRARAKTAPQF